MAISSAKITARCDCSSVGADIARSSASSNASIAVILLPSPCEENGGQGERDGDDKDQGQRVGDVIADAVFHVDFLLIRLGGGRSPRLG